MLSTVERRTTISLSPPSTPRLRLRPPQPPGAPSTLLDGGWWPRTADPVAELPGLILALDDQHSPITRVMLRRADWDSHPHRLRIDGAAAGRVVRLAWFDTMPAWLITAIRANGGRTDLVAIPPHTSEAAAHAAMEQAADPGNLTHAPDFGAALTTPVGPTTYTETQTAGASTPEDTWESEGGRLRERPKAALPIPEPLS